MRTLAIRLHDEQHARLGLLAKVSGETVTDLIRTAIDARLDDLAADTTIAAKAKAALEEIDRQVSAERDAIAALIGDGTTTPTRTSRAKPTKA